MYERDGWSPRVPSARTMSGHYAVRNSIEWSIALYETLSECVVRQAPFLVGQGTNDDIAFGEPILFEDAAPHQQGDNRMVLPQIVNDFERRIGAPVREASWHMTRTGRRASLSGGKPKRWTVGTPRSLSFPE